MHFSIQLNSFNVQEFCSISIFRFVLIYSLKNVLLLNDCLSMNTKKV